MIKYIKPKASFTNICEKKDIVDINPTDENYVVVPANTFALFAKDNEITAVKKIGTYELSDFDCDSIYFYLEDQTITANMFMKRPITGKLANGNLITVTFDITYSFEMEEINDRALEFFGYKTFDTDDSAQVMHKFIYDNGKKILSKLEFDVESYNPYDVEAELASVVREMFDEYLDPYGFKTSHIGAYQLRVNDPTFFESEYDDDPTDEKATTSDETMDNIFGTFFKGFMDATKEGKPIDEAKEEAEAKAVNDFFGSLFGIKNK